MDTKKIANTILDEVGGKDNVNSVTHCVTRLRFVLNDNSIPDKEVVSNINGVISVIEQGGQYQVVLGDKVSAVYNSVIEEIGDEHSADDDIGTSEKKSMLDLFTSTISGIFTPVLGPLAASGTIKGILAILSVTNILPESSGTYIIIFALSNAFFYFMPIILAASAAKHFKLNVYVGMIIGSALIYPTLISFATDDGLTFLNIPVQMMDYTSSVFPAIVAVWLASKIDQKIQKLPLKEIRYLVQPMIVMLIAIPIAIIVIGPIISTLSSILANAVNAVYNFSPIFGGLVIGGPWILLVMFGLHWAFIPIFINNIAAQGFDPIMGLLLANQFAMAGAAFAVGAKTKKEKLKTLSYSTGLTTLIGISEPTLYGVLLPYKKPLISAILGGSLGAMIAGVTHTVQYAFGGSGLLGVPLIINPEGIDAGFYGGIASQIIGFIAAFIITYVWGFKEASVKESVENKEVEEKVIQNDVNQKETTGLTTLIEAGTITLGEILPLSAVPDKVFAERMMGNGMALISATGQFSAPFSGTVTTLFPTKHAIGLTSDQGVELLIHVGVNTVDLDGKYFQGYVEQGQKVIKGDLLLEADLKKIEYEGYPIVTAVIVTNTKDYHSVEMKDGNLVLTK
ncbi:beta-glucoside-specific PTS transporter subunit IIABC [Enterococcus casseliflavus]|uniref:beta-glucoside-specific PTS transporter subunit IIABC n=1 Tax=Enterococcus casseliflavus TaxID=37734 RepID=UPI0018838282|nr:beta-glucoside-specific PTS transporter subunit IIABC [Enterococcus casseliflavus]MBE9909309.1 PTS transporter subunit EIIC [Enterococcus casseliflavus]